MLGKLVSTAIWPKKICKTFQSQGDFENFEEKRNKIAIEFKTNLHGQRKLQIKSKTQKLLS